jgi:hypothetical protein
MSTPEHPEAPPAGEDIHLPGPSLQPLLLCVGVTVMLIGVTIGLFLVVAGGLLALVTLIAWIRDARREFQDLPAEHHH